MVDLAFKNYVIKEVLNMSNSKYNLDYIVLDLSTLYIFRPTLSPLKDVIPNFNLVEYQDIIDSVSLEFLLNYYNSHIVEKHTSERVISIINELIGALNEKLSLGILEIENLSFDELITYLDELNENYRMLLNKYTTGIVNVFHVSPTLGLGYLEKFYTVKELTVYFNEFKTNLQAVLAIRTIKNV